MAEIGSIIDNKYELIEYINKGGMSVVYLAINTRLGNRWAIKEIRKTNDRDNYIYINSLKIEANLLKDFDHPAFPRIVDIVEDDESLYLVMDYIEGKTLEQILQEEGPLQERTVLLWAEQICEALSYLHSHQPPIIYRDMKPSNVMLKSDGSIKIIDFGVARVFNPQKTNDTIAFGTRGFAPPEQYSGQTDARSDIYALGMTMMYLISGISPNTIDYSLNSIKELNEYVSDNIARIIDKCISLNPNDRYQSCSELQKEIITLQNKKNKKNKREKDKKKKQSTNTFTKKNKMLLCLCIIAGILLVSIITGIIFEISRKESGNNDKDVSNLTTDAAAVNNQSKNNKWTDIAAISAGSTHTVGLKKDGTVVAVGFNKYGQCNVRDWTGIVAVEAGDSNTVGLKKDGTVVVTGNYLYNRLNKWKNIIAIDSNNHDVFGLKRDGTVVSTDNESEVKNWKDITAISAGDYHIVGLKKDGKVISTKIKQSVDYGQTDVSNWKDIVAIAAGTYHTVGLKKDGTVIAVGNHRNGECDIEDWKNITEIVAGQNLTVGLKKDGTVVSVGSFKAKQIQEWKDIVAIDIEINIFGVKRDGTVIVYSSTDLYGECDVN